MIDSVSHLVFIGLLSLFAAAGLIVYGRRVKRRAFIQRRLGRLKSEAGDPLLRRGQVQDINSATAQLISESGLGWTVGMFAARAAAASSIGLLLGLMVGSGFLAVVFATAGAGVLWIVVRKARARRLAQCDEQMPQALEIVGLALRAGHALPRALTLAATETPAPLCVELQRAADEHALGRPIGEVLQAFGARLPGCDAVNTFVVAVLVLQETGGNLISVIDRILENARARSNYQARLRALTAEGRQSAKLLALLPGAFGGLAIAMDEQYADMLLHDAGGNMILFAACAMWALGIVWTRRLVRPAT